MTKEERYCIIFCRVKHFAFKKLKIQIQVKMFFKQAIAKSILTQDEI